MQNVAITALAAAVLFWIVDAYDTSLRDARFLDGWILSAVMIAQLGFHVRKQFPALTVGRAAGWLRVHVYVGYFAIAAFLLHTSFSLPESSLEWVLWVLFMTVAVSGVIGLYLTKSIPLKLQHVPSEPITLERIDEARSKLAQEVDALMLKSVKHATSPVVSDYYVDSLYSYFRKPRHLAAHLRGSQYPLKAICDDLDSLERQLSASGKKTIQILKSHVAEKFDLDHQYALQGLQQVWLFVHIPATYCLIMISVLHTMIVYAYSSGVR